MGEKKKMSLFGEELQTGGDFSLSSWKDCPRSCLVLLSKKFPAKLAAHFNTLCQGAETNREMIQDPSLLKEFITPEDSLQYKYLIDVDGNASGYSRLYWILRSNSVLIKQSGEFTQWYHAALLPYIHYVPCEKHFEDFTQKIKWCENNEATCKKIAQAGNLFACKELTTENIPCLSLLCLKKDMLWPLTPSSLRKAPVTAHFRVPYCC